MAERKRDLALFNLAIDSKLRDCDVMPCASMMWLPAPTPWIGQPSTRRRQAAP